MVFRNVTSGMEMEENTSFLEQPLDRDLYVPKCFAQRNKNPLRILVTDAGGKIAYNIIYHICNGSVFGPDQEIILHLINSRGSIHHKAIVLELAECGFPAYKDFVVSCNPAVAYKKVDIVIAIATYEELPGRQMSSALLYQMIKARQVVKYVEEYASKDAKIIFTGPSTKALVALLGTSQKIFEKIPHKNVTCVTHIDVTLSKALLAAKIKTTTDKIKNIAIWSATFPDLKHTTVRMYPPNDRSCREMKDVPVHEVVGDDIWLHTKFRMGIYKRNLSSDLIKFGKAVAQSTVTHLKILLQGSEKFDEIVSMGVIIPLHQPYNLPAGYGYSLPVVTKNGRWTIREDITMDLPTQLNLLRVTFNLTHGNFVNSIAKYSYTMDSETAKKQMVKFSSKYFSDEVIEASHWIAKYFVTPNPAEIVQNLPKERGRPSRKSIFWDDGLGKTEKNTDSGKSSIRFSLETMRLDRKESESNSKRDSFYSYQTDDLVSILTKKGSHIMRMKKNEFYKS